MLIAIMEETTGKTFAEVLDRELLGPLDLNRTYLPNLSGLTSSTPTSIDVYAKDRPLALPKALASARDLVSTADDTLRFHRALVLGELFERPETYESMHERWNRIYYPLRYGLGTMRYRVGRLYAPGSKAVNLIGHSGLNGSWLFYCPELGVLTTGTVNQIEGRTKPFRIMPQVLRACFA
jgi:D-alanyl-D-alanine carboxypeptidase